MGNSTSVRSVVVFLSKQGPVGPCSYFFPPFGLGRVSTTVVDGLLLASETGMYCPVLASRPILPVDGFFAIVMAPFVRNEVARDFVFDGFGRRQLHYNKISKLPQHVDIEAISSPLRTTYCAYPHFIHSLSPFFFFYILFIGIYPLFFMHLRIANVRKYG